MEIVIFFVNKLVISTLLIGSIYAMGAIGISLIFSILRFAHFAHADLMTLGAVVTYSLCVFFPAAGAIVNIPTAFVFLPIAIVVTGVICYGLDLTIYKPLREKGNKPIILLMASIGVALMIQGLIRLIFGVQSRSFFFAETKYIFRIKLPETLTKSKIIISEPQIFLLVFVILSVSLLYLFLTRTRLGKAMRAMADNPSLALISGISPHTVIRATWLIGGGLAAAAGTLLALDVALKPDLSFHILLPLFTAAILGGIGHPHGAVIGAFIVALSENAAIFNWSVLLRPLAPLLPESWSIPTLLILVPSEYKVAIPFVILIAILAFKPRGIIKGQVL